MDVLHTDDPDAVVTMSDGRVIRNLSAAEYASTYAEPGVGPHKIPDDVLADALARCDEG